MVTSVPLRIGPLDSGTMNMNKGDYDHRRMTYLANQSDIQAKRQFLEKALKDLMKLQNKIEKAE